jgi:hypothetical protein
VANCRGLIKSNSLKTKSIMNIRPSLLSQPSIPGHPTPAEHSRAPRAIRDSSSPENRVDDAPSGTEDKKPGLGQKPIQAPAPNHEFDFAKGVIYGSVTGSPPAASDKPEELVKQIDTYAGRVVTQIKHIESGEEGESNIRFQQIRPFLQPGGYFSGGLMAAGYDPHEKITVTFRAYTKELNGATHKTDEYTRTYSAWEIAAGALKHDRPPSGGVINQQSVTFKQEDKNKINNLELMGKHLQHHWKDDIHKRMHDKSGALAKRSGKADAYVVRGVLDGLRNDKSAYEKLDPADRSAIERTLDKGGNVIIPNIYGYPLAGYAFIPHVNYNGHHDPRPNKGLMIDLKSGTVTKIHGDEDFARWAKKNHKELQSRFNAKDKQGGLDAHKPKAVDVLNNLIIGNYATYLGRKHGIAERNVPVWETFNYTQSRGADHALKFGNLESGIVGAYQAMNLKNTKDDDQTQVFGSSQQSWKSVKELWGNTFGYLPIVGTAGNVVFGIHDATHGMTAKDRVGGTAAAVISGLQLLHELALSAAGAGLDEPPAANGFSSSKHYSWRYSAQTNEFEFVRTPKVSSEIDAASAVNNPEPAIKTPVANDNLPQVLGPRQAGSISEHAVPNGEQLIKNATRSEKGVYQVKDETGEFNRLFIRYADATGVPKVYEIMGTFKPNDEYAQIINHNTRQPVMTVHSDGKGDWARVAINGGVKPDTSEQAFTPVRLKERIAGTTLQRPATSDQILQLDKHANGTYSFRTQNPNNPKPFMMDGAYAFVVRADEPDKVYMGSMNKGLTPEGKPYPYSVHTNPDLVDGHSALTNGLQSIKGGSTDVLYAGTVYIKNGKPEFWTNSSGHYQPPAELHETNLSPAVKQILPVEKFVEDGKLTDEQQKAWHDSTHMTESERAFDDEWFRDDFAHKNNEISDSDISDDD